MHIAYLNSKACQYLVRHVAIHIFMDGNSPVTGGACPPEDTAEGTRAVHER